MKNEQTQKRHTIQGTPFYLYYGGREIQGNCKWVVSSDDWDLLDSFTMEEDQLWYSKKEAEKVVNNWYKMNQGA